MNAFRQQSKHQYMREGEAKKVALILHTELRLLNPMNPDIAYLVPCQKGTHPVCHYLQKSLTSEWIWSHRSARSRTFLNRLRRRRRVVVDPDICRYSFGARLRCLIIPTHTHVEEILTRKLQKDLSEVVSLTSKIQIQFGKVQEGAFSHGDFVLSFPTGCLCCRQHWRLRFINQTAFKQGTHRDMPLPKGN